MAIEVYWGSGSPFAWRVLLALEIKKIPYLAKRLSFSEQDLKSAEFLAINPRGKVPAIKEGEFCLHESVAILCYLEASHPEPALFAGSPSEQGRIWCAIMECLNYLESQMTDFAGTIFSGQLAAKRAEAIRSRELIETELACINATLAKSLFLIDDRLTAADIVVYPVIQLLLRAANKPASETIAGSLVAVEQVYPALLAWFRRIEAIPGYQRTYPPHWR